MKILSISVLGLMMVVLTGCMAPEGETVEDQRAYAIEMRETVVAELYEQAPEAKEKIENAAGYGAFTNVGSKIFVLSTGNGYGVVRNSKTGEDTYMKMIEIGTGLGIGIKKFRGVFIFHTEEALEQFISSGWEFGGDADAAAKADEETGAAATAAGSSGELDGLEIYTFTEAGLALSATVAGTKYYIDEDLN